jgi:hypothetical protein
VGDYREPRELWRGSKALLILLPILSLLETRLRRARSGGAKYDLDRVSRVFLYRTAMSTHNHVSPGFCLTFSSSSFSREI